MITIKYVDEEKDIDEQIGLAVHSWSKNGPQDRSLHKIYGYGREIKPHWVCELTADGEEFIDLNKSLADNFVNIPRLICNDDAKCATWFGDMARFIFANYKIGE